MISNSEIDAFATGVLVGSTIAVLILGPILVYYKHLSDLLRNPK